MARFLGKVTRFATSPQGRRALEQARLKAQSIARDPATRARIDSGVQRVRSEVDRRRGGQGRTPPPPPG